MTLRILSLTLGLAWIMANAEIGYGQRSGGGSLSGSTSGRLNARTGPNRQNGLGLQSRSIASPGGLASRGSLSQGGRGRGLGQPAGGAELGPQPQGRAFREPGFVGRDAEDVRETFRNLSRGQRRALRNIVIENLNETRESRRRWHDQQRQPPRVRVQLRPVFDTPADPDGRVAAAVQMRLNAVLRGRTVVAPSVELQGRTATLRGTVSSEHEKLLTGQLVAIEPGVSRVENRLVVAGVSRTPSKP